LIKINYFYHAGKIRHPEVPSIVFAEFRLYGRHGNVKLAWPEGERVSPIPESGTKNLDFKKLKLSLRMI
jgi:hypothetical protein